MGGGRGAGGIGNEFRGYAHPSEQTGKGRGLWTVLTLTAGLRIRLYRMCFHTYTTVCAFIPTKAKGTAL